jgi:hypothetical protein
LFLCSLIFTLLIQLFKVGKATLTARFKRQ